MWYEKISPILYLHSARPLTDLCYSYQFIDQLFKLLDGKNIKIPPETNSNARIKEYNITLPEPERSFVLVDLPDFQSPSLEDQAAVLKEVVEYLGKQWV